MKRTPQRALTKHPAIPTPHLVYRHPIAGLDIVGIDAGGAIEADEPILIGGRFELEDYWVIGGVSAVVGDADEFALPGCASCSFGVPDFDAVFVVPAINFEQR